MNNFSGRVLNLQKYVCLTENGVPTNRHPLSHTSHVTLLPLDLLILWEMCIFLELVYAMKTTP